MDSHHRELELNAILAVHMNEAQAVRAIKEAEVCHTSVIKEAEVHCTTMIKEAEVHHTTTIKEAKVCCATTACILHQTHKESVLALEQEIRLKRDRIAQPLWGLLV